MNNLISSDTSIKIQTLPFFSTRLLKKNLLNMLNTLEENSFQFENPKLELILVNDREMIFYNGQYLSCQGPTNILSFPNIDMNINGEFRENLYTELGTMILSVDTLKRESMLYGQNETLYLIRLLAHGLLHLLGYDHGEEMDNLSRLLEEKTNNDYNLER